MRPIKAASKWGGGKSSRGAAKSPHSGGHCCRNVAAHVDRAQEQTINAQPWLGTKILSRSHKTLQRRTCSWTTLIWVSSLPASCGKGKARGRSNDHNSRGKFQVPGRCLSHYNGVGCCPALSLAASPTPLQRSPALPPPAHACRPWGGEGCPSPDTPIRVTLSARLPVDFSVARPRKVASPRDCSWHK